MLAWHFSASDTLANGDGRKITIGEKLAVDGPIEPCKHGLHASASAFDALTYATGPLLWRVELSGTIVAHGDPIDKYAASERTVVAGGIDITSVLRAFARQCALDVIHLWKAPDIVRRYLETGDESLRAAARDAAWAASWAAGDAAWAAARAAAWAAARDAAWAAATAAWDAAGDAAWAAATAAWDAAGDAAWAAARAAGDAAWAAARAATGAAQRTRFETLCKAAIRRSGTR